MNEMSEDSSLPTSPRHQTHTGESDAPPVLRQTYNTLSVVKKTRCITKTPTGRTSPNGIKHAKTDTSEHQIRYNRRLLNQSSMALADFCERIHLLPATNWPDYSAHPRGPECGLWRRKGNGLRTDHTVGTERGGTYYPHWALTQRVITKWIKNAFHLPQRSEAKLQSK
jgi:hypothetical protein